MVKDAGYWKQQLKQRLDRIERVVPTPRFEEPHQPSPVLYKALVSTNGLEKEIAWNMSDCEATLLIRRLRHAVETKYVGTDGESYLEFVPEYRIEKQEVV